MSKENPRTRTYLSLDEEELHRLREIGVLFKSDSIQDAMRALLDAYWCDHYRNQKEKLEERLRKVAEEI